MPIRIPDSLPATSVLEGENIFVMTEHRALHQDIRPLNLLILNLMPTKIVTETQLLRKLSNTPLQINVHLLKTISHTAQNTDSQHLDSFYTTFEQVRENRYDGMIITGAPVENLDFEDVDYWEELCQIMEWTKTHVHSTLHICWGAQAALYYYYGIEKRLLPAKLFGIFEYQLTQKHHPLLRGFDDRYFIPQSRHTAINDIQVYNTPQLDILSRSVENGINIIGTPDHRRFFVLGHFEYDRRTLEEEYLRDKKKGLPIAVPKNYYPGDNDTKQPYFTWCSYAHLFYHNWLNIVYQETPYDLQAIAKVHPCAH